MLGIDVSKDTLYYTHLSDDRKIIASGVVQNTKEGIAAFLDAVPSNVTLVLEPTGRYGLELVNAARQRGRKVLMAQSLDAKNVLRGLNSRAKTDKLDSEGLAIFALSSNRLREYPLKAEPVEHIDQLLSVRRNLARTITKFKLQKQSLGLVGTHIDAVLAPLNEQVKAIDKQIAAMIETSPGFEPAKRMLDIPGIGPITAATVCSRLNAKQFSHPDKFVAYVGLGLTVRQSGKKSTVLGLDKHGDAELRRLLYLAAMTNRTCKDSPFKESYAKHIAKGLVPTQALCAIARKLARVCWSIHKHGTTYNADRVSQQPGQKQASEQEQSPQ